MVIPEQFVDLMERVFYLRRLGRFYEAEDLLNEAEEIFYDWQGHNSETSEQEDTQNISLDNDSVEDDDVITDDDERDLFTDDDVTSEQDSAHDDANTTTSDGSLSSSDERSVIIDERRRDHRGRSREEWRRFVRAPEREGDEFLDRDDTARSTTSLSECTPSEESLLSHNEEEGEEDEEESLDREIEEFDLMEEAENEDVRRAEERRRRREDEEEKNNKDVLRTDMFGACTMCAEEVVVDPVGCLHCQNYIGCRKCATRWHRRSRDVEEAATCPFCRHQWNSSIPEVGEMLDIVKVD